MKTIPFKAILLIGLFILFGRLVELQVIKGSYYRTLAEDNRIRTVTIAAPRGKILARGGEVFVDNKEIPKTVVDETISDWQRKYEVASQSAQITGYLSQVGADMAGKVDPKCPEKGVKEQNTLEGVTGIEEQYDCKLRGLNGAEMVEVDIEGHRLRTMSRKLATPGSDVQTTIDYGLQKVVANSMNGKVGAIVATDTKGQILALVSAPSFDPNLFVNDKDSQISKILADKALPLFNRTISGAYHPGSVFKLVVGSAALNDATITSNSVFKDTGVLSINGFDYSTWYFSKYGKLEGEQTFKKALSRSTDTFFYQVGEKEGIDRLVYWADLFGLGKKTGIDIPGETAGLLPSPSWKERVLGDRWYLGNTFHFSIGQGDILTTPLQVNLWTAVFANGGYYCTPYLNLTDGKISCDKLPLAEGTISEVKNGMEMACASGGTAYPFFDFTPKVACKTGTAETGNKDKTHAWFTVFAPVENPEIVLTVLVENGGEGSVVAAPIAKEILNYWFHGRN